MRIQNVSVGLRVSEGKLLENKDLFIGACVESVLLLIYLVINNSSYKLISLVFEPFRTKIHGIANEMFDSKSK